MKKNISSSWGEILDYMYQTYTEIVISAKTFISPLKVHYEDDDVVTFIIDGEDNEGHLTTFIKNKYSSYIDKAIQEVLGKKYEIDFISSSHIPVYDERLKENKSIKKRSIQANLNPRYTFDSFIVGPNNKFAHAASLAVSEAPGEVFNPLFIYGGVGLGKTHLMHSIAHNILLNKNDMKVLYVTSENFTNELIESIRGGANASTPSEFREKYRNIDVLLIDDIQFIIGKESTQEEFFHTFNELYQARKQIIISSDKPPKEFTNLEERLRSRFEMGLITDIQLPNYETRMAILRKKEEAEGLYIDDSILDYIAMNINSNIRELEGALTKIVAFSKLENKSINKELAEEALKDIISPQSKNEVTIEFIIETVAEQYNITMNDILSNKKSNYIAFPRQICMYLSKRLTNSTLQDIGMKLGKKDHSTILYGVNKITDELEREKKSGETELTDKINILIKKLSP